MTWGDSPAHWTDRFPCQGAADLKERERRIACGQQPSDTSVNPAEFSSNERVSP